jgi:hypothetical protein
MIINFGSRKGHTVYCLKPDKISTSEIKAYVPEYNEKYRRFKQNLKDLRGGGP